MPIVLYIGAGRNADDPPENVVNTAVRARSSTGADVTTLNIGDTYSLEVDVYRAGAGTLLARGYEVTWYQSQAVTDAVWTPCMSNGASAKADGVDIPDGQFRTIVSNNARWTVQVAQGSRVFAAQLQKRNIPDNPIDGRSFYTRTKGRHRQRGAGVRSIVIVEG